jgi:VCBS repeat-containing protein
MNRHTVQFGSPYGIFLDTNGEWVRYIDHQQRIAALEAELTQSVQMYVDAAQERDEAIAAEIKADAELAKVKAERDAAVEDAAAEHADLLDHMALLLDADGLIDRLRKERDAAVADAERWRNIRCIDADSVMRMVIDEGPFFKATDRDAYIDKRAARKEEGK